MSFYLLSMHVVCLVKYSKANFNIYNACNTTNVCANMKKLDVHYHL